MSDDLREQLADLAHRQWSGWMEYQFKQCIDNGDGSLTIPASLVERWKRQTRTYYLNLPAEEQESDRAEADRVLAIIGSFFEDVHAELERAEELHARLNSAHEAYAVLKEELDEFWDEVRKKRSDRVPQAMYTELVQMAAMCARTVRNLELQP